MIERTLVLVKPDGVQRCMIGKVIERFETAGLKILGMKMVKMSKEFALKHYTEDIALKHGQHVREQLIDFITSAPVVAMVLEGVEAVKVVRKLIGPTEPQAALPGTIRGDFAHIDFDYADRNKAVAPNIVHGSGNKEEAKHEIALWFTNEELHEYETINDKFCLLR